MSDIAGMITNQVQAETMSQAAGKVQKMALDQAETQGQGVQKLMQSAEVIKDPNLGRYVDTTA